MTSVIVPPLPTLYDYYIEGGITSGLGVNQPNFTLNDRHIQIFSGAMHYFRVPPPYWRDRLRRMRAAGINTVETYVPWNLHHPEIDQFDFGKGERDMSEFLDVVKFLNIVQEEDMLAIVRPGPYICSEWEFGGLPSWLLRTKDMKIRTSQTSFMQHVAKYFNVLLPLLALLQFTKGGPIIAFQVENEYGSTETKDFVPDKKYLVELRNLFIRNGIDELLFTSDGTSLHGAIGTLPGLLFQTSNFADGPEQEFAALAKLQPGKPFMAMEFWTGWFDHWSEEHHIRNNSEFKDVLERILRYPASVNMYMFHGGTSFGFTNGANMIGTSIDNGGYIPDTTSYDYDAPLSENGDYTEKYVIINQLLKQYNSVQLRAPLAPAVHLRKKYDSIMITEQLSLGEMIKQVPHEFNKKNVIPMEFLPINNGSGQSYGYIVYKKEGLDLSANSLLKIKGRVCDTVMVLINGMLISKPLVKGSDLNGFGTWRIKDSSLNLGMTDIYNATLELVVENWGRNGFGSLKQFNQLKGLWQGDILINNIKITDWIITPLEFKKKWTNNLSKWHEPQDTWLPSPSLYKAEFIVNSKAIDTYIDMSNWTKGIVMINGFVLGRYSVIGPQQTLYLPAPFIKEGPNEIVVFEHYYASNFINFSAEPIFKTNK